MPDAAAPVRHALIERAVQLDGLDRIATAAGISRGEAVALIRRASERITHLLGIRRPLQIRASALRVVDCAGLIRVAPNLEIEVAPKFLDPSDASWREDFFLIATLSKTGSLLPRDHLVAGPSFTRDLPTLVAAAMVEAFRRNERQPLRIFRRRTISEFALDGDVDPEELFLPDPDGFKQDVIVFDRENEFNSIMHAAVRALLPEVRHAETRVQLMRVYERLSPQSRPRNVRERPLPSRHRGWQMMYDLAVQVLHGFGADLSGKGLIGPGFVLKTWTAWENLLETTVREALPTHRVHSQEPFSLGSRGSRAVRVWPDITIRAPSEDTPALVVDAKYKVSRKEGRLRIAEADLYEALAFLRATGAQRALLLYPRDSRRGARRPTGSVDLFEQIAVGQNRVWGAEVEARGIAAAGLPLAASKLGEGIRPLLP